jgi:hypothetical protein
VVAIVDPVVAIVDPVVAIVDPEAVGKGTEARITTKDNVYD